MENEMHFLRSPQPSFPDISSEKGSGKTNGATSCNIDPKMPRSNFCLLFGYRAEKKSSKFLSTDRFQTKTEGCADYMSGQ